jgi:2-polyprenyl-6-methoxyphenol hydroxylase-like FAD-dependent oxidoreductase
MHKLAIVLAAAQRDKLVIEEVDLREADALLSTIEPHMIKVFESVGVVDESRHVAAILSYVRAYNWIEINVLFSLLRNNMTERDFRNAVRIAVEQTLIIPESRNGKRGVTFRQVTH